MESTDNQQGNNGKVPESKIDLSLVSFEDMWQEMCKRYDHCVFSGVIHKSNPQYFITRKYKGYRFMCIGLTSNLATLINGDENGSLGPVIEH